MAEMIPGPSACLDRTNVVPVQKEPTAKMRGGAVPDPHADESNRCSFLTGALLMSSLAACGVVPAAPGESVSDTASTSAALTFQQRSTACQNDPRVTAGLVSVTICVGADLFMRETFGGNGRTCATCHRVENNFTIDPPFIATLPANDPLFVAEFNPALANLERPAQMRAFGLILENPDGFLPDPNVRFVLRSVPHTLSMGVSVTRGPDDTVAPPNHRTGWSGDGAPGNGELRDLMTGAIIQHFTKRLNRVAGTDFRLATNQELDAVDQFLRQLGRTNEIDISSTPMSDAGAEAGRGVFLSVGCHGCHGNAGANAVIAGGGNRNFLTNIEGARSAALAGFPRDGGFLLTPAGEDGAFGNATFNTPSLIEAADTGPFFHTATTVSGASAQNTEVATTIEQAIAFYDTFGFNAATGLRLNLDAPQIDNIGRFLRGVNAVFNIQMAITRTLGARQLGNVFGNNQVATQRTLYRLAGEELNDALTVLAGAQGGTLNGSAQSFLNQARVFLDTAITTNALNVRMQAAGDAFNRLDLADSAISANMTFSIGAGTLMF